MLYDVFGDGNSYILKVRVWVVQNLVGAEEAL